jgi:hypothetical protein
MEPVQHGAQLENVLGLEALDWVLAEADRIAGAHDG